MSSSSSSHSQQEPTEQHSTTAERVSTGERLRPFLLAMVEACLIDVCMIGLVSLHLVGADTLPLPLWVPFVLIPGTIFLLHYADSLMAWLAFRRQRRSTPGTALVLHTPQVTTVQPTQSSSLLLLLPLLVVTLFFIWNSIYAESASFLDGIWLQQLIADVLRFNSQALHMYLIIILCFYYYWRGLKLSSAGIHPAYIKGLLKTGGVLTLIILGIRAILMWRGVSLHYNIELFILLPFAFLCALGALGLSQVIYLRKNNRNGLQGSIRMQEFFILITTAGMGILFFIITIIASGTRAGGPIGAIVALYTFFIDLVVTIATAIQAAITWLLSLFHFPSARQGMNKGLPPCKTPTPVPHLPRGHLPPKMQCDMQPRTLQPAFDALPFIKAAVLILTIVIIGLVIWLIINRLKRVRILKGEVSEVRESIWSWELVWTQVKALVQRLWQLIFPRVARKQEEKSSDEWESSHIPTVQSIREIYRAFLKRAAARGYPRQKDETPYEFRQRLAQQTPQVQGHVIVITEAYIAIRYAGQVPEEQDVARVRQEWAELERTWLAEKKSRKAPAKR